MISVSLYSTKAFLFCLLSGQLVHSLFLFFFINTLLSSMLKKKKKKKKKVYIAGALNTAAFLLEILSFTCFLSIFSSLFSGLAC